MPNFQNYMLQDLDELEKLKGTTADFKQYASTDLDEVSSLRGSTISFQEAAQQEIQDSQDTHVNKMKDDLDQQREFIMAIQNKYGLEAEAARELYQASKEGKKMGFLATSWHTMKAEIDPVLAAQAGRTLFSASRMSKNKYGKDIDLTDKSSIVFGGLKNDGIFFIDESPTREETQEVLDAGFPKDVAYFMKLETAKKYYAKGLKIQGLAEKYMQSERYQQDLKDVDKYFRHQGKLAAEIEIKGTTFAGKMGGGLTGTAIFMAELYGTNRVGAGLSTEAKQGAKQIVKTLLKSAVSPIRIAATAAQAAVMPSTWVDAIKEAAPHMAVDKEGNVTIKKEGQNFFDALGGSMIDKAISVHAEKMGADIGKIGGALLKKFPTGKKLIAGLKKGFKDKFPKSKDAQFIKEFFRKAEFHGFAEEAIEERLEDFMRVGLGRQDELLPSLEEWAVELGVIGIIKGGQISLVAGTTGLEALFEPKPEAPVEKKVVEPEAKPGEFAEPDYTKAGEAVEAAATELAARHKAKFTYTPDKPLLLSDLVADKTMPAFTPAAAAGILKAHDLPADTNLRQVQLVGYTTKGNPILGTQDEIKIAQGGNVYDVVEEVFESNFKNLNPAKQGDLRNELKAYEIVNGKLSEGNELERLSDLARAAALDTRLHRKLGYRLKEIVSKIRDTIARTIRHARTLRSQVRAGNVSESFLKKIEDVTYQRAIDQQLETIAGQIQQVGVEPEIEAEVGEAVVEPEAAKPVVSEKVFEKIMFRGAPKIERGPKTMATDAGYYGVGRYFSESENIAANYAKNLGEFGTVKKETVKLNKPFIIDWTSQDAARKTKDLAKETGVELNAWGAAVQPDKFTDKLKSLGYDGVVIRKTNEPIEVVQFEKLLVKEVLPTEKPVANVFVRMPQDVLEQQAKQGVAGAKDELARRKEGDLSASIVRQAPRLNEVFYVKVGDKDVEIVKNPTPSDFRQMSKEVQKEYPGMAPGTTKLRSTYDSKGSRYIWKASEATHQQIESILRDKTGGTFSQNEPLVGELSAAIVRLLPPIGSDFKQVKVVSKRGIKHQTIEGVKGTGSLISDLMTPIMTSLEKISIGLFRRLVAFEGTYRQEVKKDLDSGEIFIKKMAALPTDAYKELTDALYHSKINKIYKVLDQNSIPRSEYHAAQKVLEQIYKDAKEVGIDLGYIEHFWPRTVKEIDELRTFLAEQRKEQYWSAFEAAIRQRERETGKTLEGQARIDYINQLIRGYGSNRIQVSGQGHTKRRVLETLDAETMEFYYGPEVSWAQYVQQMREAIEARKMFGMGKKSEQIEDPIGEYVHQMVKAKAITPTQEREVVEIFTARFNSKPPRKIIRQFRNFEYAETLGSPIVALTQLEDMGIAWYRAGILTGLPTVLANFAKAALNKSDIKMIDLGIYDIAAEMTDPAHTHKILDFILRITGFKYLDRIGKETTINTIMQTYQKQARKAKPPKDFVRRITRVFGERAGEVIDKMRRGIVDPDIQHLAFAEILDIQPIAESAMPKKYLQVSDGKVWWMLKSFMLRRLDFVLNETVRQIRVNPVQGILNGVRLTFALTIMGIGVDELKDWILGRQDSLKDRTADNLLRMAGLSKYNIYDAKARGGWKAIISQIAPPFKLVDSAGRDIRDLTTGKYKGSESLASIPVVGKILYWQYGKGYKKEKKKRIRERPQTIGKVLRKRLGPKEEKSRVKRRIL